MNSHISYANEYMIPVYPQPVKFVFSMEEWHNSEFLQDKINDIEVKLDRLLEQYSKQVSKIIPLYRDIKDKTVRLANNI